MARHRDLAAEFTGYVVQGDTYAAGVWLRRLARVPGVSPWLLLDQLITRQVFDHFTGTSRFRYTLGERIAGRVLLDDPRYFHLHGTGVFYRQPVIRRESR